ncbi:hypothetical protein S101446_03188 (plasmid) [Komagataeibacter europaeus]|nr:hypothetical protein S101446_03188 [Komagataeibacter europaeus]
MNGRNHVLFSIAAQTGIEKLTERFLVDGILVDIWNS